MHLSIYSISLLKIWVLIAFNIYLGFEGGLKISKLGGALVLFEFENKCEADLVLLRGNRQFKEREFHLQRWGPEVRCFCNGSHAKEVWVRVVGLPLHFWSRGSSRGLGRAVGVL